LRLFYLVAACAGLAAALWSSGAGGPVGRWYLFPLLGAMSGATPAGLSGLGVAALTLAVWALAETWVRRNWLALVALPATWLAGPGLGLPLYLFLRARPVD